MDAQALEQIINRIPQLKFKYHGTFPADHVPKQLPMNSFMIVNTDKSNGKGEHWIMIARVATQYYFADSFGRRLSDYKTIKFSRKCTRLLTKTVQQNNNLCGFFAIYFAWKLFSSNYKDFDNVHDYIVMDFISNFL